MAADFGKLKNLILHIGSNPHVQNLGETKLWKLIYFVDATALRQSGQSVTGSDFIRYDHGPVPSRGERALKQLNRAGDITILQEQFPSYCINRIVTTAPPKTEAFSDAELAVIGGICRSYGNKTATYLSELSHREPAWHYARHLDTLSSELMLYGASEDPEYL